MDEWLVPVCQPAMLVKLGPVNGLANLKRYRLLHSSCELWSIWLLGGPHDDVTSRISIDDSVAHAEGFAKCSGLRVRHRAGADSLTACSGPQHTDRALGGSSGPVSRIPGTVRKFQWSERTRRLRGNGCLAVCACARSPNARMSIVPADQWLRATRGISALVSRRNLCY
jgi:hypothetical protein